MKLRDVGVAAIVFLIVALSLNPGIAIANPYLAKPGEPTVRVRIGACAVTGGFIHPGLRSERFVGKEREKKDKRSSGLG